MREPPRHWGGPPDLPLTKVSPPLAVMATEAALEDYRRSQRLERVSDYLFLLNIVLPEILSAYMCLFPQKN